MTGDSHLATIFRHLFGRNEPVAHAAPTEPARTTETHSDPIRDEKIELILDSTLGNADRYQRRRNKRTLSGYPDDTLQKIIDYLNSNAIERKPPFASVLVSGAVPAATVNEVLTYGHLFRTDQHSLSDIVNMIVSIHRYSQLPAMEDYTKAELEVQRQVIALLTATNALVAEHSPELPITTKNTINGLFVGGINNAVLISILMDYPEYAEGIASAVIARPEVIDRELILDLVTSAAPSLSEGML